MTSHPASVQHRGAPSWDTCGLPNASGCQQSAQLRHLGCSYSPGGLSLQRAVFTPAGYIWILLRKSTEGGTRRLAPIHPSNLCILQVATHCSSRAEAVGWCVCAHTAAPSSAGISSLGSLGSQRGVTMGAVQWLEDSFLFFIVYFFQFPCYKNVIDD